MPRFDRIRDWLARFRAAPQDERPPLLAHLLKHVPVLLVIFVISLAAEYFGYFQTQESFALDALLNLYTTPSTAALFLVTIDDEDYETLFHGKSPLDPQVLREALVDIERGGPAVIAVDIDNSRESFADREWPKAVWTRNAMPEEDPATDKLAQTYSAHALGALRRERFLGGQGKELPPDDEGVIVTEPRSGPSLFLADIDGVIRRYRHLYYSPSANPPSESQGYIESFMWAIARAYAQHLRAVGQGNSDICQLISAEERNSASKRSEDIVLSFGGSRDRFRRISLGSLKQAARQSFWETKSPLKDAIVLVGGTYTASRDYYVTPVGPRYGMELVAHAVETTLAHGGIRQTNQIVAHVLEIVVGLVILVILWRFPGQSAFFATLVAAQGLALFASFLSFGSFAYWFNFVPVLGGLWLYYQWEQRKDQKALLAELKSLREEVARLRK